MKHMTLVPCYLSDQYGNQLNPYTCNSIQYQSLTYLKSQNSTRYPFRHIMIQGYIVCCLPNKHTTSPIPFIIYSKYRLQAQPDAINFVTKSFCCKAYLSEAKKRLIVFEIQVYTQVKDGNQKNISSIRAQNTFRSIEESLSCKIQEYHTLSDGIKRTYKNSDKLEEYSTSNLLSPDSVSYHNVFVNGILLPSSQYRLTKDELTFTTVDVPNKNEPINVLYFSFYHSYNKLLHADSHRYYAASDGVHKVFTCNHILEPASVINLYINGVLQPCANYCFIKNGIQLVTIDVPLPKTIIILELVRVHGPNHELLKFNQTQYLSYTHDDKTTYTNSDNIKMYHSATLHDVYDCTYHNLFVNGAIQPEVNYQLSPNKLVLIETPDVCYGPITLQAVTATIMNQINACD